MSTEYGKPESESAGSESTPPAVPSDDSAIAGNEGIGSPETRQLGQLQEILPPDVTAVVLQMISVPSTAGNPPALNLTEEQKGKLIDQVGRRSDQEHIFKKWILASTCFIFCFAVLAVIGLTAFMVYQEEAAVLSPILSGVGGLVAGLVTGIGGLMGFYPDAADRYHSHVSVRAYVWLGAVCP